MGGDREHPSAAPKAADDRDLERPFPLAVNLKPFQTRMFNHVMIAPPPVSSAHAGRRCRLAQPWYPARQIPRRERSARPPRAMDYRLTMGSLMPL